MKRIILDTNFLMIPGSLGVDIFSEIDRIMETSYEIFILEGSIGELERIGQEQKGKNKKAAKLALGLLNRIKILKTKKGLVDDLIVNLAIKEKDLVATQDSALKDRLKVKGVDIIVLRKKKYLKVIKT